MAPDLAAASCGLEAVNGIRCQSVATADAESSKAAGARELLCLGRWELPAALLAFAPGVSG